MLDIPAFLTSGLQSHLRHLEALLSSFQLLLSSFESHCLSLCLNLGDLVCNLSSFLLIALSLLFICVLLSRQLLLESACKLFVLLSLICETGLLSSIRFWISLWFS